MEEVKNMGDKNCGSITAGLFIRKFADNKPGLHLDIAGSARVDSPVFEFQAAGAAGAGVVTIYRLCYREDCI